jgi:hypothetical protein
LNCKFMSSLISKASTTAEIASGWMFTACT